MSYKKNSVDVDRRIILTTFLQILTLIPLPALLLKMQLFEQKKHSAAARKNSIRTDYSPSSRGMILDRNGRQLAENKETYGIAFFGNEEFALSSVQAACRIIKKNDPDKVSFAAKKAASMKKPYVISEHMNWEQMAATEESLSLLPGIFTFSNLKRVYPLGQKAAHITGYAKEAVKFIPLSENDKKNNEIVGISGFEKAKNNTLKGSPESRGTIVNARGIKTKEISKNPGEKGSDVKLSISADLQGFGYDILKEYTGSMVVIKIDTGEILAACNSPSFDPNEFTEGITEEKWYSISSNERHPLLNRALNNAVPPGSIFKLVSALSALESEKIDENFETNCTGSFSIGNRIVRCWKHVGHGKVKIVRAIAESCNPYFCEAVIKSGHDILIKVAEELGIAASFNIGLDNGGGLLPSKKWYKEKGINWRIGDSINSALGQGYILSTPLQMAIMVARIASGKKVIPSFNPINVNSVNFEKLSISEKNLSLIKQGMFLCVNSSKGTAFSSRMQKTKMAGKTGSSQVSKGSGSKVHSIFVGYAPFDKPTFAIASVFEKAGGGAKVAAPKSRDLLERALSLDRI